MSQDKALRCPKCGTAYEGPEALSALMENEGYCIAPNCGCDLASAFEDDDVWFDFFGDGKIDGDIS